MGGVKKWKFSMIYSTVNHQRVGWVGLKKSKHDDVILEWSLSKISVFEKSDLLGFQIVVIFGTLSCSMVDSQTFQTFDSLNRNVAVDCALL